MLFRKNGKIRKSLCLTPAGCCAVLAAGAILVRSLYARNAYEIALSAAGLGLCLIAGIAGAWGAKRLSALEPGWKPPVPFPADTPASPAVGFNAVTGFDQPVPWFFRIHFIVKGRFFPAGDPRYCRVSAETSAPYGGTEAFLPLNFPMSGVFQGQGFCRLRDIFGLFSFPCGVPQFRTIPVSSAPCRKKPFRIDARSGAEDRRTKNSADEERYYMREYAPGDRFRDINWKSSERIDALITRISPDNQDKVSRIEVYFRNFGPAGGLNAGAGLRDLWLMDRAKARLAQFLRSVREEQTRYIFHIRAAQGEWTVTDEAELESFLEELAGLSFAPARNESFGSEQGELYIFSTACDAGLSGFLTARQSLPSVLFLACLPDRSVSAENVEELKLRDFWKRGCTLPLKFFSLGKERLCNPPQFPSLKRETDYANVAFF